MPLSFRVTAVGSGLFASSVLLLGCRGGDSLTNNPASRVEPSRAYGLWTPAAPETCSRKDHNRYSMIGPDGKRYPTWHPPVDPVTGCSFGHGHGKDPRGSNLQQIVGDIPFGLASQALIRWDPSTPFREEHLGHRIEWENGVMLQQWVNGQRVDIGVRCDVLIKIHRNAGSTGSPTDLHELAYHVKCDDGTVLQATTMVTLDRNGASPNYIPTAEGTHLAYYDPHFGLGEPAHGALGPGSATFNQTDIYNARGFTTWHTDPLGGNAKATAFPGSIRQFIASVNNDRGFALAAQIIP